ncbi:UNVERIFIED_CONTAM: YdcF family protein [Ralstonia mannitolilytica]
MKIILNLIFDVARMLTDPAVLFVVMMIIVMILKRKNKQKPAWIGLIISASVMLIITTGIAGKFTANYLQKEYATQTPTVSSPSVIVILGGGTVRLNEIQQSHIISSSRIITAFKLYQSAKKNKQSCKILLSGNGNRNGKSEAALYASSLIEMGIPEADILKEDKSMSTYENAKYSSMILRKLSASKVYLVTSGFHMKRSVLLFKTFGVNTLPCPSDIINTHLTLVPNSYNATITSLMLGELVGIWQVQLYNRLGLN